MSFSGRMAALTIPETYARADEPLDGRLADRLALDLQSADVDPGP
jgi:hypothetical protein